MDTHTTAVRRKNMQAVKGANTGPELLVRRLLHKNGYRYRTHQKGLPGKPDIVFSRKRKIIFVHGCFWHGHHCKKGASPKSNTEFWNEKLGRNKQRDRANQQSLRVMGWDVLVLWECELKAIKEAELLRKLVNFLGAQRT